jgi:hypothetical protein
MTILMQEETIRHFEAKGVDVERRSKSRKC